MEIPYSVVVTAPEPEDDLPYSPEMLLGLTRFGPWKLELRSMSSVSGLVTRTVFHATHVAQPIELQGSVGQMSQFDPTAIDRRKLIEMRIAINELIEMCPNG